MPFTRGNVIGYDANRMMFKFTMFTPDLKVIACQISSVGLDCMKWTPDLGPRIAEVKV